MRQMDHSTRFNISDAIRNKAAIVSDSALRDTMACRNVIEFNDVTACNYIY